MPLPRLRTCTRRATTRLAGFAALGLLVIGCSRGVPLDASAVPADQVSIVDDRFEAPVIEVAPGSTVTWTWRGSDPHNVAGGGWSSEVQTSGTFSHTFDTAGTFDYVCQVDDGWPGGDRRK